MEHADPGLADRHRDQPETAGARLCLAEICSPDPKKAPMRNVPSHEAPTTVFPENKTCKTTNRHDRLKANQ